MCIRDSLKSEEPLRIARSVPRAAQSRSELLEKPIGELGVTCTLHIRCSVLLHLVPSSPCMYMHGFALVYVQTTDQPHDNHYGVESAGCVDAKSSFSTLFDPLSYILFVHPITFCLRKPIILSAPSGASLLAYFAFFFCVHFVCLYLFFSVLFFPGFPGQVQGEAAGKGSWTFSSKQASECSNLVL